MAPVIVFGPTGSVASIAATTAHENGAKVVLAMRDPKKTIPGLSQEQERDGGYERVQADLHNPDSVAAAVKTTGATRAFIYLAFGSPDHMKSTLQALKSAGITFVVFLSSFTIAGEPRDVPTDELIPYHHAQVELSLDEVFGENYVAVRPGGFITNLLLFKNEIAAGEVKLATPNFEIDAVTPTDMGRVSGIILAKGPKNGQRKVYVYGPQEISQKNAVESIGKILGKPVKITQVTPQEGVEQYVQAGTPQPLAEYLVRKAQEPEGLGRAFYKDGVENVRLYTGKPGTTFTEWVEANKGLFEV